MKSDDRLLRDMKQAKRKAKETELRQAEGEIARFYEHVKRDNIAPDAKRFSFVRMRFMPLWTVFAHSDELGAQGYYLSSTGKVYELFELIGVKAPATRSGKVHTAGVLRACREKQEEDARLAAEAESQQRRRAPWRLRAR